MRRLRWALPAVVLVLAACGDDHEVKPADVPAPVPVESTATPDLTVTTTTPAAAKPAPATRKPTLKPAAPTGGGLAAFVRVVQSRTPEIALDRRDEEIEAIAQQACASLAAGKKSDALVAETRALGTADAEATDQATARELIKLAIDTVCPDQRDRVDEF
jgi:hypothetical protein